MSRPSVVTCFALLSMAKAGLAFAGFGKTLRWIESTVERRPSRTDCAAEAVDIAERVARAAAFFPGRALCLEQSLVLHYVLRRAGIQSVLRLGVMGRPFGAHAWVEHAGAPLNESPERTRQYATFGDLGA